MRPHSGRVRDEADKFDYPLTSPVTVYDFDFLKYIA